MLVQAGRSFDMQPSGGVAASAVNPAAMTQAVPPAPVQTASTLDSVAGSAQSGSLGTLTASLVGMLALLPVGVLGKSMKGSGVNPAKALAAEESGIPSAGKNETEAATEASSKKAPEVSEGGSAAANNGSSASGAAAADDPEMQINANSPKHEGRATAYYPFDSRGDAAIEGAPVDRQGKSLEGHTLEDYLAGNSDWVAIAMDHLDKDLPYGTVIRIPELEKKLNNGKPIKFKVVDTGSAFTGKGKSRMDICIKDMDNWKMVDNMNAASPYEYYITYTPESEKS